MEGIAGHLENYMKKYNSTKKDLRISILIPCYNESKSLYTSIASWLNQTRPPDEIVVVDDCSTDDTRQILGTFCDRIKVLKTPKNTGNKSYAQEFGLRYLTGDVFIATDGDTLLDKNFVERVAEDFRDPKIVAVGGYVMSLKYNWLTACRAFDYVIGQNLDKLAQDFIHYLYVIPGAAGAFRTKVFKKYILFEHDTLTEDLDFTFKFHEQGFEIKYDRRLICYTQDPADLKSYINQMRRWYGGGWQNFLKHCRHYKYPGMALELSLIYGEGFVFSILLFVLPLINIVMSIQVIFLYFFVVLILALFAISRERRLEFLIIFPAYIFLRYVNAYVFLEQFVKEVVLRKKNLVWFHPDRVKM